MNLFEKITKKFFNNFMCFSENIYGTIDVTYTYDHNVIHSECLPLFIFSVLFGILAHVAKNFGSFWYYNLFLYGTVIFTACLIKYFCLFPFMPLLLRKFSAKITWIICLPFLITLWIAKFFLVKIHVDSLITFLPYIAASYSICYFIGLYIISIIIRRFANNIRTFIINFNNPCFDEISCVRIILAIGILIAILLHNLICTLVFKFFIRCNKTSYDLSILKKALKQINLLFLIIITVILSVLDFNGTNAIIVDTIFKLTTLAGLYSTLLHPNQQ